MVRKNRIAIIIGAGPAGLTAAYELLCRTDILPIILEKSEYIGGISKTINYDGYRLDIGGHRFFTKSKRVNDWWFSFFPLQGKPAIDYKLLNKKTPEIFEGGPDPEKKDRVMLSRSRLSRIYFDNKFFDYPVSLSSTTIKNLGYKRMVKIISSYFLANLKKIKPEKSLEDFFINRFGRELYSIFFKEYTEKLWGVPCNQIKPEWGEQRVKGLSISKVLIHALKKIVFNKNTLEETTLIDKFYYPKFGPGQLWESIAEEISIKGGKIILDSQVINFNSENGKIISVLYKNKLGKTEEIFGDFFFSSMPVKELIYGLGDDVPPLIREIGEGLMYRDFITVGLLVKRLKIGKMDDNWVYIQDPKVKLGRIQIFNNWSPYLIVDKNKFWLGLEYFCSEGDDFWKKTDNNIAELAQLELVRLGIIELESVIKKTVFRQEKAYPAYFGSYERFEEIKDFLNSYDNLFLVGRNGMHKYNNMDHSILTAMIAVDNIISGNIDKRNLWAVNLEDEYLEKK